MKQTTIIGVFILAALALLVAGVLIFGGGKLFEKQIPAVAYFDENLAGLTVGAPVTFRGVQVGQVTALAIQFDPRKNQARIPVQMEIRPDSVVLVGSVSEGTLADGFRRAINAGLRAELASESLVTGQKRVELTFSPDRPGRTVGSANSKLFEIPTTTSRLTAITEQLADVRLKELIDTAQNTLVSVDRLARTLETSVPPLLASATRTSDTAQQTLSTTRIAVDRVQGEANATLVELRGLSQDGRLQMASRGEELQALLERSNDAAAEIEALARNLNDLAEPGAPLRSDIEATTRDLSASAASLRSFTRELERDPRSLLLGRRP